jgi:hypothetical protein
MTANIFNSIDTLSMVIRRMVGNNFIFIGALSKFTPRMMADLQARVLWPANH